MLQHCVHFVYGKVTERRLDENEPPAIVPEYFSATPAPLAPVLPGKLTVKMPVAPCAMDARDCGNGDPEVVPSVAAVRTTLDTVPVPVFLVEMVKV